MTKKVVLAYSGGVDTSYIIAKLREQGIKDIIAYCADVGQNENMKEVRSRALAAGATKVIVEDLRAEFVRDYVIPAIKADAIYENKYLMATALSRPLIAIKTVLLAKKEKAEAIAHGCTGKGNDQVRFEIIYRTLGRGLEILAPMRDWEFISRENEIKYLQEKGISVDVTKKNPYSYDRNLWGISIECGVLEDPEAAPPEDAYVYQGKKGLKEKKIRIGFLSGVPVSIDGKKTDTVRLIEKLNMAGGQYRLGRVDLVENRVVGIKSREIYESPAGFLIYKAKQSIEEMTLDKDTAHFMGILSSRYSEMVYEGRMISPLFKYLRVFFDAVNKNVTGEATVRLFDRGAEVIGRKSSKSLYQEALATYTDKDIFDRKASEGFIKILAQQLQR